MNDQAIEKLIPGFTNPKTQPSILAAMKQFAKASGFTENEIKNIRDRRVLVAIHKAMMYDKMVKDIPGKQPYEKSNGGAINGPGTATSDSIPARLSDGEYVIPANVVNALGKNFFDKLLATYKGKK